MHKNVYTFTIGRGSKKFNEVIMTHKYKKTPGFVKRYLEKNAELLEMPEEVDLFLNDSLLNNKKEDLYKAIDKIKDRFGESAVKMRRP